jgi:uncharacterized protein YbjT (DUF2867 family)
MNAKVLITGATGTLGKAVVEAVRNAGFSVLQGVRDTAKVNPQAEAVRLDYADQGTIAPALDGVSTLVLMAPPLDGRAPELLKPVLAAAKSANVKQIVFISACGVNHNEQAPLRVVEHMVIESGVPYTILRPNFFMENFSEGPQASGIKSDNAIYLAAGDGKTSFISVKDIAAVVALALKDSLTGAEIDLTGPEALDHIQVAEIISKASGRTIDYHSITEEQMLDGARSHGMPEPVATYLGVLYSVVRAGHAAGVAPVPASLSGYRPRTFQVFAGQTEWNA